MACFHGIGGEGDATALNILQDFEPSRTQREGEAPAELWLFWLRRSVALPTNGRPPYQWSPALPMICLGKADEKMFRAVGQRSCGAVRLVAKQEYLNEYEYEGKRQDSRLQN